MNAEKEIADLWDKMEKLAKEVMGFQDQLLEMMKQFKTVQEAILAIQKNVIALNTITLRTN